MASQKRKSPIELINSIPAPTLINRLSGANPVRTSNGNYWYISMLRSREKTPSFKVNVAKNVWFDYQLKIGGKNLDLLMAYWGTTIKETLEKSKGLFTDSFSFDQPIIKQRIAESNITIASIKNLNHPALVSYLKQRGVLNPAMKYAKEIHYNVNGKNYFGIAFKNSSGYVVRNQYFKGCTANDITFYNNGSNSLLVFEGFINWFSWLVFFPHLESKFNHLILNSVSNLDKAFSIFSHHKNIICYLDNDKAGMDTFFRIKTLKPDSRTSSILYSPFNDLNDYLQFKINRNKKIL